jgi:ABC-type lipoprotein release transport system permease subunit
LLLGTPSAGEITGIVRLLDPVPYMAGVIVVITACLCAALVPTWRAVRIDPIATLRNE